MTHNEFVDNVIGRWCAAPVQDADGLRNLLHLSLQGILLKEECTDVAIYDTSSNAVAMRKFIACKMVEGCTQRTLRYYAQVMKRFFLENQKPISEMATDDIRLWMAIRVQRDGISKCTQNNERRILNTFFNWAVENDVVVKSPMRTIKKIKQEKRVRKPFSDIDVERLRHAAQNDLRLTAILEVLLSTGVRVGELVGMNRDAINEDEIIVFGKGSKERTVYLNARAIVALRLYLESRPEDDNEPAMFAAQNKPYARLKISAVESQVRELGKQAGIQDVHPHRFRRTAATMALNRGMPIDQVQQMLGHEQIATTLIYAQAAQTVVKQSHKKYM